jgi:hypothetical protein
MSTIALSVTNDLAVPISLNVLGGTSDENNQNNADTLYEWDLSAENWVNVDTIIIQSRLAGQTLYQNYSTSLTNLSVQGVALTLSTLNLGNFLSTGNIVYTYNRDIQFGDITLTLTNVPSVSAIMQQAYDYFVPAGSTLRQQVYPNNTDFANEWEPAFNLLLTQTNAGPTIEVYGIGCIMPLFTSSNNSGYVVYGGTPKAPALRPILSQTSGTTQGYNLTWTGSSTNAILFFPSGDATEIANAAYWYSSGYLYYHAQSKWSALSDLRIEGHYVKLSGDGMFDSLTALNTFMCWPAVAQTYPTGWKFPSIDAPNVHTLYIDAISGGPAIIPTSTMTTSTDFVLSTSSSLRRFQCESLYNVYVNQTQPSSTTLQRQFFIQYSNYVVFGPNVNTYFANFSASVNPTNTFNVGFTNNFVSWANLTTPLQIFGINSVVLIGNDLSAFPTISDINYYGNWAPLQWTGDLRLNSNNLSVATVNNILIQMDAASTGGYTVIGGYIALQGQLPSGAPPSGGGITAKNNLIAKGITVLTD